MLRPIGLRSRSQGLLAIMSLWVFTGCGAQQRAAEKLIEPRLRSEGVVLERGPGRDLVLGRYRVEGLRIDDEPYDGHGALAPDAAGRTRPTQQLRLEFSLAGGEAPWTATCVGQRRQPPDHDLAAAADEPRDEVAVHCQIVRVGQGGEQRGDRGWVLRLDGSLATNLVGRLDEAARAPESRPGKIVEVVLWHRLWNISRRRLPATLGLIRSGAQREEIEAALIFDAPERAWLAPELDETQRELALTALLALRLVPLGFDS
jgi:hypothetical protein